MARKLDQILVVDVESTCWDGTPPDGEETEIIEIGICALDVESGRRVGRESILVRPVRSTVSAFCTGLTTLTQEQVDSGIPFQDACARLRYEYQSRERLWASWGDYDRRQFERQCQAFDIAYPFGQGHLNVKTLFAVVHALPHELGMDAALQRLGFPLEGTHHRADDDAWNIAAILSNLLLRSRSASMPAS